MNFFRQKPFAILCSLALIIIACLIINSKSKDFERDETRKDQPNRNTSKRDIKSQSNKIIWPSRKASDYKPFVIRNLKNNTDVITRHLKSLIEDHPQSYYEVEILTQIMMDYNPELAWQCIHGAILSDDGTIRIENNVFLRPIITAIENADWQITDYSSFKELYKKIEATCPDDPELESIKYAPLKSSVTKIDCSQIDNYIKDYHPSDYDIMLEKALSYKAATSPDEVLKYISTKQIPLNDNIAGAYIESYIHSHSDLPPTAALKVLGEHTWKENVMMEMMADLCIPKALDTDSISAGDSIQAMMPGSNRDYAILVMANWLHEKGNTDEAKTWASKIENAKIKARVKYQQ